MKVWDAILHAFMEVKEGSELRSAANKFIYEQTNVFRCSICQVIRTAWLNSL